jgi:hypothetical protein
MNTSGNQLSDAFKIILGPKNISQFFGVSDEEKEEILCELINYRCHIDDSNHCLKPIPDKIKEAKSEKEYRSNRRFTVIEIAQLLDSSHASNYLEMYMYFDKKRKYEIINELKDSFEYSNLFEICKGEIKNRESNERLLVADRFNIKEPYMGEQYFPQEISTSSGKYIKSKPTEIFFPNGEQIGGIVWYSNKAGNRLAIPGKIIKWTQSHVESTYLGGTIPAQQQRRFVPGRYDPLYHLLREPDLEKYPNATVFLCDDLYIAELLNKIIIDSNRFEEGTYISTASYGGSGSDSKKYTDFGCLHKKNVIYIPAPCRESYIAAFAYCEYCTKAGAELFKVLNSNTLFPFHLDAEATTIENLSDPFERHIAKNAIILADPHESVILQQMDNRSVSLDKYKQWAIDVGILDDECETIDNPQVSRPFHQLTPEQIDAVKITDICTDVFAGQGEIGAIIASTHTGKTQFAIAISITRSCGLPLLNYKAIPAELIIYMDGETPKTYFDLMATRAANACNADIQLLKRNFYCRNFKDEKHCTVLDLAEEYAQTIFEGEIQNRKPKLMIIDSLISLAPGYRQNSGYKWKKIFQWCQTMQKKYNCAFLFVHHTNEENNPAGTKDFESLCSSIFVLENPRQHSLKCKADNINDNLTPYMDTKGTLFQAKFTKNKHYHQFVENQPFGAYLAIDPDNPVGGPPWERIDLNAQAQSSQPSQSPVIAPVEDSFPSDEQLDQLLPRFGGELRKILVFARERTWFTRKDVDDLLDCKRDKSSARLNTLINANLIDYKGSSKDRLYHYRAN